MAPGLLPDKDGTEAAELVRLKRLVQIWAIRVGSAIGFAAIIQLVLAYR